jgi:hypothetical protein
MVADEGRLNVLSVSMIPDDCRASKQARPFLMIFFLSQVDVSYPYSDQSPGCHKFRQFGKEYIEESIADQQ